MGLTCRSITDSGLDAVVANPPILTGNDLVVANHTIALLQQIEECVTRLDRTKDTEKQPNAVEFNNRVRIYRGILAGAWAITHWQLGQRNDAAIAATKLIFMGHVPPVCHNLTRNKGRSFFFPHSF